MIDFSAAKYSHSYPKKAPTYLMRTLSDLYSQENCEDYNETREYATKFTQGRCLYCGKKLYTLNNGIPMFQPEVQYDHILPASIGGLFAKGNIVLACAKCNQEKNNMSLEQYYKLRFHKKLPILYSNIDNLMSAINVFAEPYRKNYSGFMGIALATQSFPDLIDLKKVVQIFEEGIDLECTLGNTPRDSRLKKLVNAKIWLSLKDESNPLYELYSDTTIRDCTTRVTSLSESFIKRFGLKADIEKIKTDELIKWINELLKEKATYSKSEHGKYLRLTRIFLKVFNRSSDELLTFKNSQ